MRSRATTVALAAAVLLAAGAAPAGAKLKLATFRVTIEGRQHTTWEYHHVSEGPCDAAADGFGEELVRFHTPKPVVMRALWDPATPREAPILIGRGATLPKLPLGGTIRRSATRTLGTSEMACPVSGGGGSAPPVPPDCGTKRLRGSIELGFDTRDPALIVISEVDASSPFRHCTAAGEQFPSLTPYDTRGRRVGQRIPTRELFAYGKHIAIARGTKRVRIPETSADTDITWTVTFTRARAR
jgi:hypothetical protein